MTTIDNDTRLKALGLFTLAQEHAQKAREFEAALARLLGREGDTIDRFSDALYGGPKWNKPFDELLRLEGFEVAEAEAA